MLSSGKVKAGMIESYYDKDNYYFRDRYEIGGDGIKEYSVDQAKFDRATFEAVCNLRPESQKKNANKALDFTFSAPKSVSVLHALGDKSLQQVIRDAHDIAVQSTVDYMQDAGLFKCRDKRKSAEGKTEWMHMQAKGILYSKHLHDLSRNQDPQLHTHVLIANTCKGPDGKIRAIHTKELSKNKNNLGAIYRARLAKELTERGLKIEITDEKKYFWEVRGCKDETLKAFSSRRTEIEERLREQGRDGSAREAQIACKATRRTKQETIDRVDLLQKWQATAVETGLDIHQFDSLKAEQEQNENKLEILSRAVAELENFAGVFSKNDVIAAAARNSAEHGIDAKDLWSVMDQNLKRLGIVDLIPEGYKLSLPNHNLTTQALLDAEKFILDYVGKGKGMQDALDPQALEKLNRFQNSHLAKHGWNLNQEQQENVLHVLTNRDRVIGIQGYAGTGKTTLFACVNSIKDPDIQILGLSNQAVAAKNLQDETGIQSTTIDSFLMRTSKGRIPFDPDKKKRLLIIDETSFAGSKQLKEVFEIAERENIRVVLVGDKDQLQAVVAGKPFEQLQQKGMLTQTLKDIRRQKNQDLNQIVTAVATKYECKEALDYLIKEDCVKEIRVAQERHRAIATEFVEDYIAGRDTLVVTQTNASRRSINDQIRFYLRKADKIDQAETQVTVMDSQESKADRGFSVRDRIVFLKNDKALSIQNGNLADVVAIKASETGGTEFKVRMGDGRELTFNSAQYAYFDHGFSLTTYKSQGKTHDKCIYDVRANSPMTTRNEFYVAISRERYEAKIFTDNLKALPSSISRKQQKKSAVEEYGKLQSKLAAATSMGENRQIYKGGGLLNQR